MIKRILIVLSVMLILGGFISKDAFAGPPWPAEVLQIRDGDFCYFTWMDEDFDFILLYGPGMWEYQYHNGVGQWNCHTTIDFDDPGIASLDQVCDYLEGLGMTDYCQGNGSYHWNTSSQPIPLTCMWEEHGSIPAQLATWVTTPNGNTNITCHFDFTP